MRDSLSSLHQEASSTRHPKRLSTATLLQVILKSLEIMMIGGEINTLINQLGDGPRVQIERYFVPYYIFFQLRPLFDGSWRFHPTSLTSVGTRPERSYVDKLIFKLAVTLEGDECYIA